MPDFTPDGQFSLSEVVDFMNDRNGVDIGANNISLKSLFATAQENGINLRYGDYTAPHKMSEFLGIHYSTVPPGSPILRLLDQDGNEITWTQDEIILDVGDEVPPYIFGIGPNDITLNFEPPAPDTILMLVKAGDWEHVTWEGDFISSTSGEGNDDGQFIEPTITTVDGGVEISIASKAGNWQYEMQRIEMEVFRRVVSSPLVSRGQWFYLEQEEFGDLKNFITHNEQFGNLNDGDPITFDIPVLNPGINYGNQNISQGNYTQYRPTDFVDTEQACRLDIDGWSEILWPENNIDGVQSLIPREAGRYGCVQDFPTFDASRWYVQYPGTKGTRSILCFKFTKL
jgi:hypothetical protein